MNKIAKSLIFGVSTVTALGLFATQASASVRKFSSELEKQSYIEWLQANNYSQDEIARKVAEREAAEEQKTEDKNITNVAESVESQVEGQLPTNANDVTVNDINITVKYVYKDTGEELYTLETHPDSISVSGSKVYWFLDTKKGLFGELGSNNHGVLDVTTQRTANYTITCNTWLSGTEENNSYSWWKQRNDGSWAYTFANGHELQNGVISVNYQKDDGTWGIYDYLIENGNLVTDRDVVKGSVTFHYGSDGRHYVM